MKSKVIIVSLITLVILGVVIFLVRDLHENKISYKLMVDDEIESLFIEHPKKEYKAGEKVILKTAIITDVLLECFVNGESIGTQEAIMTNGKYHWEFSFVMPSEDVMVTHRFVGSKG